MDYGLPYLFYEDTAGGHSGDADIEQGARLQAMQMVYFSQSWRGNRGQAAWTNPVRTEWPGWVGSGKSGFSSLKSYSCRYAWQGKSSLE